MVTVILLIILISKLIYLLLFYYVPSHEFSFNYPRHVNLVLLPSSFQ